MKKRLILKRDIKKAYSQELEKEDLVQDVDLGGSDIEKVPGEIFEILSELVSFIEKTNKFQEDGNENK